jgi:hypothetical protein
VFFTWKCIKIIFFFILKKLFLISAHQNDLKTQKIYQFEAKKFFFKKKLFLIPAYQNNLKKHKKIYQFEAKKKIQNF